MDYNEFKLLMKENIRAENIGFHWCVNFILKNAGMIGKMVQMWNYSGYTVMLLSKSFIVNKYFL